MKFVLWILLSVFFMSPAFTQAQRQHILLDDNWKFSPGHATDPAKDFLYGVENDLSKTKAKGVNFSSFDFDDSKWEKIDLPHDWAVALPFSKNASMSHGYKAIGAGFPQNNIGWYRKKFNIDAADSNKLFELQFDGIYRDSRVWINGMYLGNHASGYIGVKYDISDFVNYGKENIITVRVDASQSEGWFYEGAGIYKHAWLNIFERLHTKPEDVFVYTSSLETGRSGLQLSVNIHNRTGATQACQVENLVYDKNNIVVARATSQPLKIQNASNENIQQKLTVVAPVLWELNNPYQYKLITKIISGKKVLDELTTKFGIRTFKYTADGFYLNNKKVLIKGVCCHQDHAGIGVALPDEMQSYRIRLLKEMGANAYRSAHHPPTPELIEACDSLGMLVMSETRLLNSGQEYLQQFEQLIKRDRNHASVFMWSVGNEEELIQTNSVGKRITRTLLERQRSLDPSRVSTFGANVGNVKTGVSEVIDVRGFNYNLYGLSDYKKDNPLQPVIGAEVASTVSTRGVYLPEKINKKAGVFQGVFVADSNKAYLLDQDLSYPSWASTAEQWFTQTAKEKWFMGGFVWTGFDYRGEPTPFSWPNINSHFGVMDVCGFPKNVYYYYQSWWTDKDVLRIAPNWNLGIEKGTPVKIWVYSNADSVELFVNGKSFGRKIMVKHSHLNWEVPYALGTLKAIGYRNGRRFESEIKTTGKPQRIVLMPHKNAIKKDGRDVVVVNVSVFDAKNNEVPDAGNLLKFQVTGGKILGVGNGDPSSHEADKATERKLFNGKCQVIVQSLKNSSGSVVLRAESSGLEAASINIR